MGGSRTRPHRQWETRRRRWSPRRANFLGFLTVVLILFVVTRDGILDRIVVALDESYEAAHARLVLDCAEAAATRNSLLREGKLPLLPEASQVAANQLFVETVLKLCSGLEATLNSYQATTDAKRRKTFELWQATERR